MPRQASCFFFMLLLVAIAVPALAQKAGPNGGLLAGTESHQLELVVSPTEIAVYVLEHGKPHDTKGVKIKAIVQHAGKTTSVDLAEKDGNKLVGQLTAPLGKGAIVVLSGKDDHGEVISARYTLQ